MPRSNALDGQVVCLRAAAGEDHLARMRIDQRRHLFERGIDRRAGAASLAMHTRGIAKLLTQVSSPRQFFSPPQRVASMFSLMATMISATEIFDGCMARL